MANHPIVAVRETMLAIASSDILSNNALNIEGCTNHIEVDVWIN